MTLREDLTDALQHPNVLAFLRVIRAGESSQDDTAYRMMVGGDLFSNTSAHPNVVRTVRGLPPSTAAGAYQFLHRTWQECREALDLPDFSPASQDVAAVYLIRRRGALADVLAGRFEQAVAKCANEWASLPGSPYGQPTRTMAQAKAVFMLYGGALSAGNTQAAPATEKPPSGPPVVPAGHPETIPAGEAPSWTPETKTMAPIIAALLPTLIESIPKLGRIFGSGSAVAERNIKAAEIVMETVKAATGSTNEQQAVERIKADPAALQAATAAVDARWVDLTETGGGGIDGARKADAAIRASTDMLHSPSFWIALALLPLVYMIVANLIGLLGTSTWSDDARAGLAGTIVGSIIGGLVGYYFGQTTSRNRSSAPAAVPPP